MLKNHRKWELVYAQPVPRQVTCTKYLTDVEYKAEMSNIEIWQKVHEGVV